MKYEGMLPDVMYLEADAGTEEEAQQLMRDEVIRRLQSGEIAILTWESDSSDE